MLRWNGRRCRVLSAVFPCVGCSMCVVHLLLSLLWLLRRVSHFDKSTASSFIVHIVTVPVVTSSSNLSSTNIYELTMKRWTRESTIRHVCTYWFAAIDVWRKGITMPSGMNAAKTYLWQLLDAHSSQCSTTQFRGFELYYISREDKSLSLFLCLFRSESIDIARNDVTRADEDDDDDFMTAIVANSCEHTHTHFNVHKWMNNE